MARPRAGAALLVQRIQALPAGELLRRQRAAEQALLQMGITFNVYGDAAGTERIFPFDLIPRIVEAQRLGAHRARVEAAHPGAQSRSSTISITPSRSSTTASSPPFSSSRPNVFSSPVSGLKPPRGVWCHITGTDLVRDRDGQIYVLEDNLRCPSGVSYVLENRQVMKRTFPQVFEASRVRPVDDYPSRLLDMLQSSCPGQCHRSPTRGGADARDLQLGLLRARLPGAADGR